MTPAITLLKKKRIAHTILKYDTVVASTGYLLGGVSPLGQKKRLATVLHKSALTHEMIYVSAGKRGLELEIPPQCIINLTQAKTAQIAAD